MRTGGPWYIQCGPRGAAQRGGGGGVGLGLRGQVVEDEEAVLALVHPVLADGRAGVGGDVLDPCRLRRRGGHDRRVLHRTGLLEGGADAGGGGALLAGGGV